MKRFLLTCITVVGCTTLFAQNIQVKGQVVTAAGEPVVGATVLVKGEKTATLTGKDGRYSLSVPPNAVLIFTYSGHARVEEKVRNRTAIDISLAAEARDMDEVVVVGYGTARRKELTGSISSVSGKELSKVPVQNLAQSLQGRVAGMQVTQGDGTPGSTPQIVIRGGGSITQSNEPLYVVDGVPQTDGLAFLDPTDVESIDVLKDASATAIYGARGANGVVLVTTKRPKTGKLSVNYDMYFGAKKITKNLSLLHPYQYALLEYERSMADSTLLAGFTARYGAYADLKALYEGKPGINWQDELFGRTANNQYHKISVGGGSKETRFNLFYSHNNDEGIMLNSGAKKDVAKLQLNHSAGKKLKLGGIVNYSEQTVFGVGTQEGSNRFNQLQNILQYRPMLGKSGSDQDLLDLDEDPALSGNSGNVLQNPITNALSQSRTSATKALNLNVSADYELFQNLTYRGLAALRRSDVRADLFNDARSMAAKRNGGPGGSITQTGYQGWNYSNTLSYAQALKGGHKMDVLLGQEQVYSAMNSFSVSSARFPATNLGLNDISQGTLPGIPQSSAQDERMVSYFTRANVTLADRYIFSASFRRDGSSKFGPNNKYGNFPAAAFAWRVINESFMSKIPVVSDLKLRLSMGTSGNNRINNYLSLALLQSGSYPLNNNNSIAVFPSTLANPDLRWETTRSQNFGLDLGFWKQRIQLTADLYDNRTRDLLLNAAVPATSGFTTMLINVGSTRNRGLELTLNTVNVRRKAFEWNSSFNLAFNRNKVTALTSGETARYSQSWGAGTGSGTLSEADYLIRVGEAVGQMYGYQFQGLYQVGDFDYNAATGAYTLKGGLPFDANMVPQPGYVKLKDQNNDGRITTADRVIIGDANPKFTGGLNNTFRSHKFDLSVFVNWSVGNDIYNANKLYNSITANPYPNAMAHVANRWMTIDEQGRRITDPKQLEAVNAGKTVPSYIGAGTALRFHDGFVEDGSFIRLNNLSLGYTFPSQWLSKAKISNARVYLTGYNLLVLTNYSGYDPEVSVVTSSRLTPGVDFGAFPRSRSLVAGLNVSF
ncbi:TonB-dependent receptor [Paraflavisolibacter sp. H34]|uniref:SusC/RagA family TonB-linked outer membrane protein n=1 Tax=Huijunlia imazamoxiresistens TaxID=3127457 RepID=UPI003017490C